VTERAEPGVPELSPRRAAAALAPLLLGTFTGTVSNTAPTVPLGEILTDLDVPLARGALVVVAFTLTFAVLMPLSGWLGDRLGRRRLFCAATVGLAAGAVGAALAPDLPTLIAARVVQGLATAAVLTTVMSLLASLVAPRHRGRALGVWAAVNGAGHAAGPAIGGVLTAWIGWRAVFGAAAPLALLALLGALWLVPRDAGRRVPLEWRGALLLTAGAGLLVGAASAVAPLGAGSPLVWASAGLGAVAVAGYLVVERGRSEAFLPPALLLEGRYARSSLAVVAQMFALGATLLAVPLHLLAERGLPVALVGAVVLALPLTMTVLAPVAGLVHERLGGPHVMRAGLAALVAGQVALALVLAGGSIPILVAVLVLVGVGVAFVQTPAATGATRSRAGRSGAGLGLFNLLRFGGSAVGAAWVAAVAGLPGRSGLMFGVCAGVAALGLAATFLGGGSAEPVLTRRPRAA
jgi:MFS family permease